ncbi:MAG: NADH-quinone oxidoreductase subunit J, partial [Acidobacteria bacterium]|nr:NADH-quinone oxidoreductase subunit J [Acidobacteriota bacterium]
MESMGSAAIFYATAAVVLGSALYVVVGRNLVHSAFALVAAFFGVAVFYVYLGADFLAGAQVL